MLKVRRSQRHRGSAAAALLSSCERNDSAAIARALAVWGSDTTLMFSVALASVQAGALVGLQRLFQEVRRASEPRFQQLCQLVVLQSKKTSLVQLVPLLRLLLGAGMQPWRVDARGRTMLQRLWPEWGLPFTQDPPNVYKQALVLLAGHGADPWHGHHDEHACAPWCEAVFRVARAFRARQFRLCVQRHRRAGRSPQRPLSLLDDLVIDRILMYVNTP